MADIEYLLPIIRSLKSDLVIARQYEAAKHIRDAECVLLPQGPPSMDERIKRLEQFIDGSSMQCSEMSQRIEKMEKALSQEMARTREMDDILAGVVRCVGYVSEEPKKPEWIGRYFQGTDPVVDSIKSKFASARFLPDGFQSADYNFAFDALASPSGIPFSVALEFLKAGRKVRRPGFAPNWCWRISTDDIISPEGVTIHPQSKDVLATDWVVVPEPQNP